MPEERKQREGCAIQINNLTERVEKIESSHEILHDMNTNIKSLKEQLRQVPNKGMGYALLKYTYQKIHDENSRRIRFNYLGDFDNIARSGFFHISNLDHGSDIAQCNHLTSLLEINSVVLNQELHLIFFFDSNVIVFYPIYLTLQLV